MRTCKSCGGSGWRLRPLRDAEEKIIKTVNFRRCSGCGGHGSKPAPIQSQAAIKVRAHHRGPHVENP